MAFFFPQRSSFVVHEWWCKPCVKQTEWSRVRDCVSHMEPFGSVYLLCGHCLAVIVHSWWWTSKSMLQARKNGSLFMKFCFSHRRILPSCVASSLSLILLNAPDIPAMGRFIHFVFHIHFRIPTDKQYGHDTVATTLCAPLACVLLHTSLTFTSVEYKTNMLLKKDRRRRVFMTNILQWRTQLLSK